MRDRTPGVREYRRGVSLLGRSSSGPVSPGQDELDLGEVRRGGGADGRRGGLDGGPPGREAVLAGRRSGETAARAARFGEPDGRVVATSSQLLWQVLTDAYAQLGFDVLGDEAFRAMVLARIVGPTIRRRTVCGCWERSGRGPGRCARCSGR